MADLEIDYHLYPAFDADAISVYHLDREFLSLDRDTTISRAPDAPCLRHRAGSWWIDNDSDRTEATVTLWTRSTGRQEVPRRASYALPDGQIEICPWDTDRYKLLVTVTGSDPDATRPGRDIVARGRVTEVGRPGADDRLKQLFHDKHRTRIILAAHFRDYLVRGSRTPRAQDRHATARCMGFERPGPVDSALQEAQKVIWGELGHVDWLPSFLIHRGHLRPEDQMLVPHKDCGHLRPGT